jgi:hypothetical protein
MRQVTRGTMRFYRSLLTVPAFGSDIRFALRQIRRTPLLCGVIIGVIALGIGINAGLLTVINTHVWRPAIGIPQSANLARAPRGVNDSDHLLHRYAPIAALGDTEVPT